MKLEMKNGDINDSKLKSHFIKITNGVRIDIWTHFMRECIINYVH